MDEDFDLFKKEFKALASKVKCTIEKIDKSHPDIDEIMHAISIWVKKEAEIMIESFEKKHGSTMNELYVATNDAMFSYLYQIELKKVIQDDLKDCIDMA
jgi:hypothetical protein